LARAKRIHEEEAKAADQIAIAPPTNMIFRDPRGAKSCSRRHRYRLHRCYLLGR
jgi:hypothetical protein